MYLPEIISLIKDMARNKAQVDKFSFSYNRVNFDVLVLIDRVPFELLFGIVDKNVTFILKLHKGYQLAIPSEDEFTILKKFLNLNEHTKEDLNATKFLHTSQKAFPESTPIRKLSYMKLLFTKGESQKRQIKSTSRDG